MRQGSVIDRATPARSALPNRAECDRVAFELRTAVQTAAKLCPGGVPSPRDRINDLAPERRRRSTIEDFSIALVMIARAPRLPRSVPETLEREILRIVRSLFGQEAHSVQTSWEEETRAQALADVEQARGLLAVQRGDVIGVRRAIEASLTHRAQLDVHIAELQASERALGDRVSPTDRRMQ